MGPFADRSLARSRRSIAGGMIAALSLASVGAAILTTVPAAAAGPRTPGVIRGLQADSGGLRPHHGTAQPSGSRVPLVAPRTAPACNGQFSQVPGSDPGTYNNYVQNNALAAITTTDVWAVGVTDDASSGPDKTLVEHWDGSNWASVQGPNPRISNQLWGVAAVPHTFSAINNLWVVGSGTDTSNVAHTMAAEYANGGYFAVATTPDVGAGNNRLAAVTAISANDIWAVGSSRPDNTTTGNLQPLVEHFDGMVWTVVASPQGPQGNGHFYAMSATSATDIWAVGVQGAAAPFSGLIEHYDGTSWSVIASPSPLGITVALYSVTALSATSAWVAGYMTDYQGNSASLVEHWNGTNWSQVTTPNLGGPSEDNLLYSIAAVGPNNVWASGTAYGINHSTSVSSTLLEHWNGNQWAIVKSPNGLDGSFNELNAVLPSGANVWVAGDYVKANNQDVTLFENACIDPPTVTGVAPVSGNTGGGTQVTITGTNLAFETSVNVGGTPATNVIVDSNTELRATMPAGTTGTVDVTVTNPAGTSMPTVADTYAYVPPAITWRQYTFTGSDGMTWQPVDAANLSLTMNAATASDAILSGNADLWTSLAGVNQDLGIMVNGGAYTNEVVGWKESGGYAGIYSPNAAFVQAVIPIAAATTYTVQLVWKSNKPTSGTIFIAAGNGPAYSPTRLTAEQVPAPNASVLQTGVTNEQYFMPGNNGAAWQDIDTAGGLTIAGFTPATRISGFVSANVDLWTTVAGVNQDVGILVSGGNYGAGQIVAWKESGGFAGTFSPNAAYAQAYVDLAAGTAYSFKMQWKTNKPTSGTIVAAAGAGPTYSPTRLTLRTFAPTAVGDVVASSQFHRVGSTGGDWLPVDTGAGMQLPISPATTSVWALTANADLWTATPGVNQDLGIFISGGAYGNGTLVAWKESGGYAGTYSPNAAFVQTLIPLAGGTTYTITLGWKTNQPTSGTIYAGAGGGSSGFSPTRVSAQQIN